MIGKEIRTYSTWRFLFIVLIIGKLVVSLDLYIIYKNNTLEIAILQKFFYGDVTSATTQSSVTSFSFEYGRAK